MKRFIFGLLGFVVVWIVGLPSPVFDPIETQFTWLIKQTPPLLARTFSLQFAGNFAGSAQE
jgi:hypothetical protein